MYVFIFNRIKKDTIPRKEEKDFIFLFSLTEASRTKWKEHRRTSKRQLLKANFAVLHHSGRGQVYQVQDIQLLVLFVALTAL